MAVRLQVNENSGLFYITFTCLNWIPLFEITNSYDLAYKWFDYLKGKGHFIIGYVIMPNHLHVIIAIKNAAQSINTIVSNGKRFMAYEMVNRLKEQNKKEILESLSVAVTASDSKRGKLHQVFEPSFDCKECYSEAFTEQKLNYIHQNPCKGVWNLAVNPIEYMHSSAKFYLAGEEGAYEVKNYKELMDIDLGK